MELLPRYRQKLGAPRTGGLAWPSWERDERFDIDAHVRHATLPPPGDEPEFLDWISDFYSHRLDRGRPLWEIVLLDGLAGGRWALVSKTHHCLVDNADRYNIAGGTVAISTTAHDAASVLRVVNTGAVVPADMVERLFNGSPSQLVLQALGSQPSASREELKEIRALLKRMDTGES